MTVRRFLELVLGWGFILVGIVGLFLPLLQGILFILVGLGILARHSPWAKRLLDRIKKRFPKLAKGMEKWKQWAKRHLPKRKKDEAPPPSNWG